MKKILLNESEKKAIILERYKAIIANFTKTFNSIKRVDENEINEYNNGPVNSDKSIEHMITMLGCPKAAAQMVYDLLVRHYGVSSINIPQRVWVDYTIDDIADQLEFGDFEHARRLANELAEKYKNSPDA